jgi:TolB-like protein/DNA-binding winged helix-turn-helix (wHTH) protein/Tfp pilus assembly protein PilF
MTADFAGQRVDLAKEADFRLGQILVGPSTRQVEAGGASETLEPRIMQVLVALARRRGDVVSRDELIETCWEGRIVGDDALNRCISRIRKLGEAKGDFRLETIPRIGYRLLETPQPGQLEKTAATDPAPTSIPPPLLRLLVSGAIALAAVALVLAGWSLWGRGARAAALEPSIAVLPFANLTGDDGKDYLGRGIAMEIIDTLSQLDGIKVIARNSSFAFDPDADPRSVGQDLKVAHVLSGTVSEESGRIRVTADLADVKTGEAIWARPFVRDLAPQDPYAVQRLIAEQVSGAMSIAFDLDARAHLAGSGTRNLEAYDFYLRGLDDWWYDPNNRRHSVESFARAVELDPDYADAWAGRAIAMASRWGMLPPDEARVQEDLAYAMAQRAVQLDPNLSFAQAVFGAVSTTQGKWNDAEKATRRALEISRTHMALNNRQLLLLRTGRISDAYSILLELRQSDPLRGPDDLALVNLLPAMGRQSELQEIMTSRGWSNSQSLSQRQLMLVGLINAKAPDASIRRTLEGISQRPEEAPSKFARAVLAVFEEPEKAREALRSWYEDKSFRHVAKWDLIPVLAAWYGDTDMVLRVWKDELPGHIPRTVYIWGPAFANARARPEFKALVEEIGLVDYWREHGWADKCRPLGDADFECG